DGLEQCSGQTMLFEQSPELEQRGRIRGRLARQIDANETADRLAVVERVFHALTGQPEALLRDVHAQHPLQANWRTAASRTLGVERFERADHRRPRRDSLDLCQKALAPGLLLLVGVLEVGKTGLLHEPWCRRLRGAIVSKAR